MLIYTPQIINKQRCITMQKHCWRGVCSGVLCHNERRVKQWDGRSKAGSHQSGRCFQISETFRLFLAGPSHNLSNLFIYSVSLHLLSKLQPAAKKKEKKNIGQPPTSPFLLCHTVLQLPPNISMSDTSCLSLRRPFTVLSSLVYSHPPSDSCFRPSYIIHLSLQFPLLSIKMDGAVTVPPPEPSVTLMYVHCAFTENTDNSFIFQLKLSRSEGDIGYQFDISQKWLSDFI